MNIYYQNYGYDVSSVFNKIGEIDEEYEKLKEEGKLTDEDLIKLNYRKFVQGLKLNTGYVRL